MQPARVEREGVGGANVEYEGETVIASVTGIYTGPGRMTVDISAEAIVTAAAGAEKTTLRIRREGVAGTLVLTSILKAVASAEQSFSIQCEDEPGEVAGLTYVLTAQESKAGTKNKSVSSRVAATF